MSRIIVCGEEKEKKNTKAAREEEKLRMSIPPCNTPIKLLKLWSKMPIFEFGSRHVRVEVQTGSLPSVTHRLIEQAVMYDVACCEWWRDYWYDMLQVGTSPRVVWGLVESLTRLVGRDSYVVEGGKWELDAWTATGNGAAFARALVDS
ncbi:hypothetical protein Syun_025634 [Stephania yunnanensis]|uniref:Uncharacterized protein n=1 Tax=Stephania yunnanensis TaxID=152371 RepID=A0AAP0F0X5_9MAGN